MVDEEMDKNECYEHGDNESHESFQRLVCVHDLMTSHSDSKEGGLRMRGEIAHLYTLVSPRPRTMVPSIRTISM